MLLVLTGTLLAGCQKPQPRERSLAPPASPVAAAAPADEADACLDAKLKAAHLNAFGDPAETVYAGGSPLFDEATGRSVTRREYLTKKHPELTATCPTGDGGMP